jgi:hypothetical protein
MYAETLKAAKAQSAKTLGSGFLYLIPTFCVWMRIIGPAPARARDLATPTSARARAQVSFESPRTLCDGVAIVLPLGIEQSSTNAVDS